MTDIRLFTDGSVNPKLNIGYGAYLIVFEDGLSLDLLRTNVHVKRFEKTSSTKLELQTLLWALSHIKAQGRRVMVFTDSQNIIGLKKRRTRLEQNNYKSKKNNRIKNYALYQKFYQQMDQMDLEFVKVQGHKPSCQKEGIDRLFTLVDRASRNALRRDKVCI